MRRCLTTPLIGVVVVITTLASCRREKNKSLADTSELLFQKSEQLIRVYIDSIKNAKDSLALYSIIKNFDGKITNLNYEFPPDADLAMSEEENDSLITLYKKLEAIKAHQDSIVMNKILTDSLNTTEKDSTLISSTTASHIPSN